MNKREIIKRLARISYTYDVRKQQDYAFNQLLDLIDELEAEK